jgi:hypothetical protein
MQLSVSPKSPVGAIALILSGVPPVFVTVNDIAAEVTPTAWVPKLNGIPTDVAGESVTAGGVAPVPVRFVVCVPNASTTVSTPFRGPTAVGVKTTLMVQDEVAATDAPQGFGGTTAKSPLAATLVTGMATVLGFMSVAAIGALGGLSACGVANVTVGCGVSVAGFTPVPLMVTLCGLAGVPLALSVN